ncbi:MAG: hypothetical protein MZV70_39830 [Desulfobacterales bacterium]|nr:hypothetical protein [Desulfobacterales bacterium]
MAARRGAARTATARAATNRAATIAPRRRSAAQRRTAAGRRPACRRAESWKRRRSRQRAASRRAPSRPAAARAASRLPQRERCEQRPGRAPGDRRQPPGRCRGRREPPGAGRPAPQRTPAQSPGQAAESAPPGSAARGPAEVAPAPRSRGPGAVRRKRARRLVRCRPTAIPASGNGRTGHDCCCSRPDGRSDEPPRGATMRSGLRVLILLVALVLVLGFTIGERQWVRGWGGPLEVAIYPIAVDEASRAHVARLTAADIADIGAWLETEARQRWRQPIPAPQLVLEPPPRTPAAGAARRRRHGDGRVQPAAALVRVPQYAVLAQSRAGAAVRAVSRAARSPGAAAFARNAKGTDRRGACVRERRAARAEPGGHHP